MFKLTIKTCVYGTICFIISGMLYIQEVYSQDIKENLFKDKILEIFEKIPQSEDKLYIGPLRIHPSLEISETYDDNVFNSDSSVVRDHQDFYETYNPEISLELPLKNHSLNFDYGLQILEYHHHYKIDAAEQNRHLAGRFRTARHARARIDNHAFQAQKRGFRRTPTR